jgi:hypothetical protein
MTGAARSSTGPTAAHGPWIWTRRLFAPHAPEERSATRRVTPALRAKIFALVIALPPPALVVGQVGEACCPETGFCVIGPFRSCWEANGGLPVFAYLITPERPERNRDTGRVDPTQ